VKVEPEGRAAIREARASFSNMWRGLDLVGDA
jgi:hypothetical protein